ncbi:hypothetical protein DL96DRAFT_1628246 [Flagelloscypha sp. PMI_526]|nr:hypothetical protein DL96DRAFT_1628246 [Flagelloscypha sp. PMI_526]
MSSSNFILLQHGADAFNTKFQDRDGQVAYTVREVSQTPNPKWQLKHPDQPLGPENGYLYFGPARTPGSVFYGSARDPVQMSECLRKHRESTTSRYFKTLAGKDIKWRFVNHKMECVDGRTTLALWELSDPEADHHASLTIYGRSGLGMVTELVTMLTLNRIARDLEWS